MCDCACACVCCSVWLERSSARTSTALTCLPLPNWCLFWLQCTLIPLLPTAGLVYVSRLVQSAVLCVCVCVCVCLCVCVCVCLCVWCTRYVHASTVVLRSPMHGFLQYKAVRWLGSDEAMHSHNVWMVQAVEQRCLLQCNERQARRHEHTTQTQTYTCRHNTHTQYTQHRHTTNLDEMLEVSVMASLINHNSKGLCCCLLCSAQRTRWKEAAHKEGSVSGKR